MIFGLMEYWLLLICFAALQKYFQSQATILIIKLSCYYTTKQHIYSTAQGNQLLCSVFILPTSFASLRKQQASLWPPRS
jgi:hypothetical protein